MKLLFKQRIFSWFDSYDIYNEHGETVYTVEGKFGWGHRLHICDANGVHIATLKQELFSLLPSFELYENEQLIGYVRKKFSFFKPCYDALDWSVEGNFLEWDYTLTDTSGNVAATISKEIFNFTDTYSIDVAEGINPLYPLMVTLAIDAEKCSRK